MEGEKSAQKFIDIVMDYFASLSPEERKERLKAVEERAEEVRRRGIYITRGIVGGRTGMKRRC